MRGSFYLGRGSQAVFRAVEMEQACGSAAHGLLIAGRGNSSRTWLRPWSRNRGGTIQPNRSGLPTWRRRSRQRTDRGFRPALVENDRDQRREVHRLARYRSQEVLRLAETLRKGEPAQWRGFHAQRAAAGDPCREGSAVGGGTKTAAAPSAEGCLKKEEAPFRVALEVDKFRLADDPAGTEHIPPRGFFGRHTSQVLENGARARDN